MRTERPTWDEWAVRVAQAVATRADCTRRQVGAVVLDADHRIISTGYNGAPSGAPGCATAGACPRGRMTYDELPAYADYAECIATHAEANALAVVPPGLLIGATMYVTHEPCDGCRLLIARSPLSCALWPAGPS